MTRSTFWRIVAAGALVLGCGSASVKPSGPVSAVEVTDVNDRKAIPAGGVTEVDVNSSIELNVSADEVKKAFAKAVSLDDARLEALETEIQALREDVARQKANWEEVQRLLDGPIDPARAKAIAPRVGTLEEQAGAIGERLAGSEKAWGDWLRTGRTTPDIAVELLGRAVEEKQKEIDGMLAKFERVRWRMQASVIGKNGPEFVHLDGYDVLEPGSPRVIDKLALPVNLAATAAQARTAAADIQNLATLRNRVVDLGRKKAEDLLERLKNLEELEKIATSVEKAAWATQQQAKTVLADLKALTGALKVIVTRCHPFVEKLGRARSSSAFAELGQSFGECSTAVRDAKLPEKVAKLKASAKELVKTVEADVKLAETIRADLEPLSKKLEELALAELDGLLTLFGNPILLDDPSFASPEQMTDRPLRNILNPSVNLVLTRREPGDLVYHRSAVVVDGVEVAQWTSTPMRVVTSGWHVNVSGSVVFVQAFETEPGDSSFPAAPAATAALHFHAPRGSGENRSHAFWNFLDPGLGMHFAYLDLGPKDDEDGDPGAEIGLGGTLQLFGDIVQGGVAYDLQVKRPYFFFGVGLQTLTELGLTVPAAGN